MRRYVFFILLLFFLFLSLAFTKKVENIFPLFGKLIILDPGHGGLDPGAVYMDKYEKDYNLMFSFTLKTMLEKDGATVLMTRYGDYDLSSPGAYSRKRSDFNNRIQTIDDWNPDVYISLHMNYLNEAQYYGAQTFYATSNGDNKQIAELIQKEINQYFSFSKDCKKISDDKYMFKRVKSKGVLIEYGFISSPKDRQNLMEENYRKELAEVIIKSLIKYFM